ncbi:MAG TPA: DNA polymerase III subunit alpha [Saprospiraceae bacterium]|nr:DNA polymerase III subunit alpha [Saprospiraceae bacterium]HMQ82534.1 DNA polymerase III subunit alpha [Saprospiraceae bacterium]
MPEFVHLHCHTQFSLLDGATDISAMMDKAAQDGQKGVALTDHGNMFGAFKFVAEAEKRQLKPIIGCEFYLVEDRHKKSFSRAKGEEDVRHHQLLLAKNQKGYENLSKLCSLGFIEGLYSKFPRIDKELLLKHHEGLIATSCCIGAEIPQTIMKGKLEEAEQKLRWWLDIFGDDYYIELQRHKGLENIDKLGISQEDINQELLKLARKYNLKVICTNDSHYLNEDDYFAHDILLCVNTNSLLEEKERFRFPSSDFYFKTQAEMERLFHDVPESLDNTLDIYDKIEKLSLTRDILLPAFPLPQGFASQDDYLRHLTYEGAKRRYGTITPEIKERLDFELKVVANSGYPGYFLIVQDFTNTARQMGVSVGPGRGSAAGSAVAYCIGITNVDPIKYDLLFERFLNPERVSMPDIDIDFDDVGRQKVIDYVIDKYGRNQVAQIVTYGTMAAKLSLRDVGRVLNVPLPEVDRVSKTFPTHLKANLKAVLADGDINPKLKEALNSEDIEKAYKFRELAAGQDQIGEMIRTAQKLEGSVRNTGIHACGVVITPDEITKYVPVKVDKESDMLVTQFDNSVAEAAGLLKMDFLGLKTLTIIKDAVAMIEENHGIKLDMDTIPLEDTKTYELFQRGETVGIFQYESPGMQKYMKELVPTTFEDLIAMNALYRPGPLEYIPDFIDRKHGRKPVTYDLDAMEEYLHETYGVCLSGDTLVFNAQTGQSVRIDQLKGQEGTFWVQGVDEHYQNRPSRMTHWVCNGKRKVLQVKLRNGLTIKLTQDHQVLTEKGWQPISELETGDYIATPRSLDVEQATSFCRDKLRIIAYLLADGSLSAHAATADFISKNPALIAAYVKSLEALENLEVRTLQQVREVTRVMVAGTNKTHYHQTNSLVNLLRELGLKTAKGGCRSDEKFIPSFIFGLTQEDIAFFLASLWDCDGYIGSRMAHFKTISKHLASGVQTLLLRLGIQATIYESTYHNNRRNQQMTAYQVSVYDIQKLDSFISPHLISKHFPESKKEVSLLNKDSINRKAFLEELNTVWDGSARNLEAVHGFSRQHFITPTKQRERIATHAVEPLLDKLTLPETAKKLKVRWEEIVEISPAGEELVYDITVEGIHNFVANNMIVHNCVYQEQVMLLSQKLAGFTKGQADMLRKAMGKKQKAVLDALFPKFIEGGTSNQHPQSVLEKVWKDWEAFASYAFNKSHSTCYAFVAFQTAYLKAHYPAEFMASVLTHNKNDISKITFFLQECKRMGLKVLGPSVNESASDFSVNKTGAIRFGLSALKGVGEGPVEEILEERRQQGNFVSLFDLVRRMSLRSLNKKVLESLALGGAFDCFESVHRAQYFAPSDKYDSLLEHALKYGNAYQGMKAQAAVSLFGETQEVMIPEPPMPECRPWPLIEKLNNEKLVTGIFVSGHPLDDYQLEMENFITCTLDEVEQHQSKPQLQLAGMLTTARHMVSKNGNGWGIFEMSDYKGSYEFKLFGEDYQKFKHLFEDGKALFIKAGWQKSWRDESMELKIKEVSLLEGVAEKMTDSITLKLPLETITPELVQGLTSICEKHKGQHRLKMVVLDRSNQLRLKMAAKEQRVNATNGFILELEQLGVEYELN